jgi:SAM-dependent methyltransferase
VVGELRRILAGRVLGRGISVGCGDGSKEQRFLKAGLVDHFDLFEVSAAYGDAAVRLAEQEGLSERITVTVGDAFAQDTAGQYDLVYWDHSLHHMMDVDKAIAWSIAALAPGGWLVINDYVGPTRLVWRRDEVDFGREFLRMNQQKLGFEPKALRYKNVVDRFRLMMRDPSEAPQSDRIMAAYQNRCGAPMTPLGGVMIHLCAPFLDRIDHQDDPMYDALIASDRQALEKGQNHFAFGAWQKPAA